MCVEIDAIGYCIGVHNVIFLTSEPVALNLEAMRHERQVCRVCRETGRPPVAERRGLI